MRPQSVPTGAVWAGGPDGGEWIQCAVGQTSDVNLCTVYADTSGVVLLVGEFVLEDTGQAASGEHLKYRYYANDQIYLQNGSVLTCVRETPERPAWVPKHAILPSRIGVKYWVDCSIDGMREANLCTLYSRFSPEPHAISGFYLLQDESRPAREDELMYEDVDPRHIYLLNLA